MPGWHAQGITVAYERARGVRVANQRCDRQYEVSASKVMNAPASEVMKALTQPRIRRQWMKGVDPGLGKALTSALDNPASKGIVIRPDGLARFRYRWGNTTVPLYLSRTRGKVSFVATNTKLSGASMVEARRAQWRQALDSLAKRWSPSTKRTA